MPLFVVELQKTEYLTWLVEAATKQDAENVMRFTGGRQHGVLLDILEDDSDVEIKATPVDSREDAYAIYGGGPK